MREEDLGAVCGHPVKEDAVGGAGGEVDRFAGVADVHVEVPVLGVAFFGDEVADHDPRAVLGDVELADFVAFFFHRLPRRGLGDDVGFFAVQVAVIDRDFAFVCVGLELAIWSRRRSGCRRRRGGLPMKPAGLAAGWGIEPAMPWTSSPFGQVDRDPGGAVCKAGRADFGAAEGEGVEARVGFGKGRGEGARAKGSLAGMPTYLVLQPFSPRVAT